jgi:hypothetical protein
MATFCSVVRLRRERFDLDMAAWLLPCVARGSVRHVPAEAGHKDGEQLRGGVSTGLGAAARLHFGQPDAAGNQSVGFGFDLTIGVGVEFDVRTRAPGKAMQWLGQGVMNALGLGGP